MVYLETFLSGSGTFLLGGNRFIEGCFKLEWLNVLSGVLHGSVLGPIMFISK